MATNGSGDKSLESWIWDAACSIRGAKDAPKYKEYILPLIFAKRLCDVFDDELNRIAKEVGSRASYVDSKGYPALWSSAEYLFYFDLTFGKDYSSQQQYIRDQLESQKISLNVGHRILAAFLEMGLAKVIFTTNFDEVIETAFSAVAGKQLWTVKQSPDIIDDVYDYRFFM